MKFTNNITALILSVLLVAALFVSCTPAKDEESQGESSLPEVSESTPDSSSASEESQEPVQPQEPKEYYAEYYDFEIPDFPDAETERLALIDEDKWCVNNAEMTWQQLFTDDETANKLAYAIYLIDSFNFRFYDFCEFESVEKANSQYLLYAAISSTPRAVLSGVYGDTAELATPDNIVSKICAFANDEHGFAATELVYAADVEKTFHYLFGDSAKFAPETIYNRGYRYVPGAGIYISCLEGAAPARDSFPQIIEYSEENGIYTVQAVPVSVFEYDDNAKLNAEITKEKLLSEQSYTYTFEKAKDGHFILLSIAKD